MHDLKKQHQRIRRAIVGLFYIVATLTTANLLAADSKPAVKIARRVPASSSSTSRQLASVLKIARSARLAMGKNLKDYRATFIKRERIGSSLRTNTMQLKVREKPFSVYLLYQEPHEGREAIYVKGKNNEKLLAHGSGLESLVGTIELSPTGRLAMRGNRYPITMIGMSKMLDKVIEQWESELKLGGVEVKYYKDAKLGDVPCRVIQTTHSSKQPQLKFYRTRLYLEKKRNLPIRVEQYGFPKERGEKPPLAEQYTYSNIKKNIGMKDIDFDPKNPAYGY